MNTRNPRIKQGGFGLLEILASLALFAIVVGVLSTAISDATSSLDKVEMKKRFITDIPPVLLSQGGDLTPLATNSVLSGKFPCTTFADKAPSNAAPTITVTAKKTLEYKCIYGTSLGSDPKEFADALIVEINAQAGRNTLITGTPAAIDTSGNFTVKYKIF